VQDALGQITVESQAKRNGWPFSLWRQNERRLGVQPVDHRTGKLDE
jgi:hypothetical protein